MSSKSYPIQKFPIIIMSLFVTQIFHQLVKSITLLRLTLVLIITIIVLISIKVFSNEENDITNLIFHPIPGHELSPSDPLILQYLRDHHLTAPPHNRTYFDPKTLHPLNYHVLRAMQILFGGKVLPKGKFFLECGANDGQFISNTIKLEVKHNWTGVLVEGSPSLVKKLKNKGRNAWVADICLGGKQPEQVYAIYW